MNKKEFDFLGITRFHELGYKGQGIKVASFEEIIEGVFDDVFVLNYGQKGNDYSEHGTLVMDYIRQVVPEAEKFSIDSGRKTKNGKVVEWEAMDYLMENTPDFLGTANHSGNKADEKYVPYYKELYDKGCFLVCSAGNKQDEINKLCKGDLWKAIGACDYNKGKPKVKDKYVDDEEMDFVSFHDLYSNYNKSYNEGTSFSYEIFMGMCALVQCFFLERTGQKLSHKKLMQFAIDNSIDLGEEGKDIETGYGLFILPDPNTIDISKYCEDYKEVEEMKRYNTLEEVPEWGKETVEKLIQKGALKGDENSNLDISEDLLRTLVIHDRLGLYE